MRIKVPGFLQRQTSIPLSVWFVLLTPILGLTILMPLFIHTNVADSFDGILHGDAEERPIVFATLRKQIDDENLANRFSGERGNQMRYGVCHMSFEPVKGLQQLSEEIPFYVQGDRKTLTKLDSLDSEEFQAVLNSRGRKAPEKIVVYTHGYNVGFEKACRRAAILQHEAAISTALVLFSWPADGNALNYVRDEADLEWSVHHLAKFLTSLSENFPNADIDLIGHSLGGRGMTKALASIGQKENIQGLFNQLILLAPDIDKGLFVQLFPLIKPLVNGATLYASDKDNALKVSNQLHGYPRLGEAGEFLTILEGLDSIDVSDAGAISASGHLYHLYNSLVLQDLSEILHTGVPAKDRSSLTLQGQSGAQYWKIEKE